MSEPFDDDLLLIEEDQESSAAFSRRPPWRILVVDDDQDVHEATTFALSGLEIFGRALELVHAYSGEEAIALLRREPGIAVILLDVVMESEHAGLRTVDAIRNELKLPNVRIILRTGQPGQAPEAETITQYDINDYKTKSELSQSRLFTTLISAIRSYDQLERLDANRLGLEKIVSASNQFIADKGLNAFAEGVITQLSSLIGVAPEGLVCAAEDSSLRPGVSSEFQIIAAAGHYRHLIQQHLGEIDNPHIVESLSNALRQRSSIISDHDVTLYFRKSNDEGFAAYIESNTPIREVDQHLLEVFCTNIALCAKNIDLVANLRRDALVDRQVGLPNRNALIAELDRRLADGLPDEQIALVDIDQFAAANDMLGHRHGDALLNCTAERLRTLFDKRVYVARLAGDAFALAGPGNLLTPGNIQRAFAEPFIINNLDHLITVCIGIAPLESNGPDTLKNAYVALRRAKGQGLGQSVVFSRSIGLEARERTQLLHDLRLAFDQQQLFLAYQPQVELASKQVVGAEALMRWRLPNGQMIPPDRFIPLAEQSGLIVNIGRWLLRKALEDLQRFRAAGYPELCMAINISAVQLRQADFVDYVNEVLIETGTDPHNLELEITESVVLDSIESTVGLLKKLRAQGIRIAIDDFGTGYSSLNYLEQLPVDNLKIDRSFVLSLSSSERGARIVRTIALLGNELEMRTVAEGVEDADVGEQLHEIGYHVAQGYHYAKPMAADDFLAWLRERQP